MNYPKYDGHSPSRYLFWLVCFLIGIVVLTVLFLGQIKYDDREGPGWSPITTMPDGKVGISTLGAEVVGVAVLLALGWLVSQVRF
jgi:hypothetical protein